jgi:predicted PurR-regulated permease PerM
MLEAKSQLKFFTILALVVLSLAFFIVKPYLASVFLAIVFVIVFYPVHQYISKVFHDHKNLSSLLSTFLVLLVIFIPVSFFGFLVFQEARTVYEEGLQNGAMLVSVDKFIINFEEKINNLLPGANVEIKHFTEVEDLAQQGLSIVVNYFDKIFTSFLRIGIGFFLMIFAIFYLFRDGDMMMNKVHKLSPLKRSYTDTIFKKVTEAVNAVIRGRLLVGVIQGFVIGVGFALFGLPSPVLWGGVSAIAAILPVVGPLVIIVSTSLILFFSGSVWTAIGILAWGIVADVLIDEYLSSILIDQKMHIHPFLILLSVLGGISFFGAVGFVIGPVVLALMFAILEIYPLITSPDAYEVKKIANYEDN